MSRWLHWAAMIAVVAALTLSPTTLGTRAQTAPPHLTAQQMAQKLLATKAADHMTAPALTALRALAGGNRQFGQDSAAADRTSRVAGRQLKGRVLPSAPGLGNVRVNDPGEDTHQPSQTTQSETTEAVAGNNVAVGFNDSQNTLLFFTPGTDLSGYAYSHNGGQTFTDGGVIPNPPGAVINLGDPWLASDAAGSMYYSTLIDDPFAGALEVGVAKSTNGGQNWAAPVALPPPPGVSPFGYSADKPALTSSSSGLYDGWDDFTFNYDPTTQTFQILSGLPVAHSTDGGQTWSSVYASQVVESSFSFNGPPDCSYHQYIGAQPAVGPDGTVYVAALRFDVNDPTCSGAPETESEYIFASHDGGTTFGPAVKIADVTSSTQGLGAFILGQGEWMRNVEFPTLAFMGGSLFAAWNDGGDGSGHSHIRLARSSDGGATWATSWVTSGANDEAQPAISADASGLHILYYEISSAGDGSSLLDVYVANSTDGSTFSTRRVTNQSFPGVQNFPNFDPIIAFAYMGDYISNVSDGVHQYFAWGDNRDVVTDFLYSQGRHDPDVFFSKN